MPMKAAHQADKGLERRRRLLWLSGVLIVTVLSSVLWSQLSQHRLLSAATEHQDDYLQVSLGYLESEYLKLRLAWAEALAAPEPDRDKVQLRYDIFVSRVALLESRRSLATVRQDAVSEATYQHIRAFIAEADRVVDTDGSRMNADSLRSLQPALLALGNPIHSLVVDGSHHLADVITQRTAAMRETNRNTLLLTMLLTLAATGFALLSIAQYRRLDQRRQVLEDLTDDLRQARSVAVEADAAKSNFLANMSHEIRTPLQGVLGMLALLAESPLTAEQRARLLTARGSADHLLVLLNDILDLTKLEADQLAILPGQVDLPGLLHGIDALVRAQATVKGLDFEVALPDDLPRWVSLDATRVRQVLLNLCSNAIKFTDTGRVRVSAEAVTGRLHLIVEDSGIGIDDATLGQLFKRFSRGNESRDRLHGGTGLGLEISRRLAQRMGGDITVTSRPGEGSRFVVDLPLQAQPAPAAQPLAARAVERPEPGLVGRTLRVLVVDDNEVNRSYTGAVLEHLGHEMLQAEDGAAAVAMVRDEAVDLVLMDLHMPGVDGLEATRTIRKLGTARATLPIVALTADAFAETRAACLGAGMDDFVTKPVSPEDLRRLVATVANRSASA
jgi:two-component system, sensor histidine kinase